MRGAVTCFVGLGELVSGDADHNARVNNAGRDWNSALSNGAIWRLVMDRRPR